MSVVLLRTDLVFMRHKETCVVGKFEDCRKVSQESNCHAFVKILSLLCPLRLRYELFADGRSL